MDLPVLNQLEKIYPNQDNGAQAISKLVRNQNLIEQGIKDAQLIEGPQGPQGEIGPQGNTPFIGVNGNWWIGEDDTGISADAAISVQELQEQINDLSKPQLINQSQVNDTKATGFYAFIGNGSDGYTNGHLYLLNVYGGTPTGFGVSVIQVLSCVYNADVEKNIRYRTYYSAVDVWQPWQQITTTSTWKSTSSNLVNGWQAWGGIYLPTFTRNGNVVTVTNGNIGSGAITVGTIILTGIPTEYIPSSLRTAVLKHSTGACAMAIVDVDGTIKVDTSWGGSWLSTGLYDVNFSYHLV